MVTKRDHHKWEQKIFWHLRFQSLLSFTRKDIAKFTGRRESHIFSKIQKHRKSLEEARAYIRKALESTPADYEVIRIDNNTKRGSTLSTSTFKRSVSSGYN
jgi:hypothetical protein